MLHFFEDCLGGGDGVGSLGDGAAYDEVAGSCGEGRGGGGDAFLVGDVGAGGADAGDDERRGGETMAEGGDFFGAGDESVDAGLGGGVGETDDLGFR